MSSNNAGHNGGRTKPSPAPPRSMLANLLSSQQRSAAQSRKHLVQRAMPFANLHKEGSSGNAAIKSISTKDGLSYSSSEARNASRSQLNELNEPAAPGGYGHASKTLQEKDRIKEITNSIPENNSLNKHVSFITEEDIKLDSKVITSKADKLIPHDATKQKPALKKKPMITNLKSLTDTTTHEIDRRRDENAASAQKNLKRKQDHLQNGKEIASNKRAEAIESSVHVKSEQSAETTTDDETKSLIKVIETSDNLIKKKKKQLSPFRVKVGCVVAVRFRKLAEGGNASVLPVLKKGDSFYPASSSVENNENDSLTVDVSETKEENVTVNNKDNDTTSNAISEPQLQTDNAITSHQKQLPSKQKKLKHRKPKLVEVWTSPISGQDSGIALLGRRIRCFFPKSYLATWQKSHENACQGPLKRIVEGNVISILDDRGNCTSVGLLIDRALLKLRPYLQIISDQTNESELSSSEQKRRNLEAIIRGKDKVIVEIILSTVYGLRSNSITAGAVAQWVVAKHVLTKPSGMKPTKSERKEKGFTSQSLFVGDRNDTFTQQEDNWRWSAGRMDASNSIDIGGSQLLGEVVKMDVGTASLDGSTSLATVTIRQLLAPHQTKSGRMPHHRELELLDITSSSESSLYFQAPVEALVVIGRRVDRHLNEMDSDTTNNWCFNITHSYETNKDVYTPLSPNEELIEKRDAAKLSICHNCRRLSSSPKHSCNNDSCDNLWCLKCLQHKGGSISIKEENWIGPCCCVKFRSKVSTENGSSSGKTDESVISNSILSCLTTSIQSTKDCLFKMPAELELGNSRPSFNPHCADRKRKQKKRKLLVETKKKQSSRKKLKHGLTKINTVPKEDYNLFKPSCCRLIPFDEVKEMPSYIFNNHTLLGQDGGCIINRNAPARKVVVRKMEEKSNSSDRAARASQRRMLKSLTGMGESARAIDRLSGRDREEQLRFGRSLIHGWGVFATEAINAGDMIIEYRGELIGNAVADKREIEYER